MNGVTEAAAAALLATTSLASGALERRVETEMATRTMVTRFPGTWGSASEPIGSTVSSEEPVGALLAHSGAITAEMASIVDGNALPITKAQARPAMTAR